MSDWTFLTKFIIVGEQSVGKSAILIRLTEQRFLHNTEATIGVEFGTHLLTLDNGDRIKIQVWDTAGSEAFRSITRSYYRGAAGALLVFSLVHRSSFLHIQEWLQDVREHAEESVSIVLVGNMADLAVQPSSTAQSEEEEEGQELDGAEGQAQTSSSNKKQKSAPSRQVTREEAEAFAKKEGLIYVETSARTGQNIDEAFARAAKEVHRKFLAAQSSDPTSKQSATIDGGGGGGGPAGFLRTRTGATEGSSSARRSRITLGATADGAKKGCCVVQ
ncbi:unnamed protein product [Tilletia controversa]|uniref:Uncharacterized protein n=3 Tax=Tilletia TaxID=13289 RepID=A0A8X7MS25_9BASI|nr:hypothetical protein CF328_g7879 [Tilletia controversa]KAE8185233.1 hypothetical protein CF335_g7780 [Tilletia laevis]KAE8243469.1 hypothetical protein A4X03_0g7756 [Tilletia caries]KAE8194556.1 hypothetical protein CF336_g3485 [Tilletia laevis]KAE8245791.1 hypothetical protein A4X06_0g5415 [Tilletia controversa]